MSQQAVAPLMMVAKRRRLTPACLVRSSMRPAVKAGRLAMSMSWRRRISGADERRHAVSRPIKMATPPMRGVWAV